MMMMMDVRDQARWWQSSSSKNVKFPN